MTDSSLPYELWIDQALRDVVKKALAHAAQHGLAGAGHFYITFRTEEDGVRMAPRLRAQHAQEMTIVLQHQFRDLAVDEETFSVTLKFGGKPERLTIPFSAVTAFADPSVNFGLQLKRGQEAPGAAAPVDGKSEPNDGDATRTPAAGDTSPGADQPERNDRAPGEVITLDTFRKK